MKECGERRKGSQKKGKKRAKTKKINRWISTHWRRGSVQLRRKKKIDLTGWNFGDCCGDVGRDGE